MKILYVASTFGHLINFHTPYIKELMLLGHEVHIGGKGNYIEVNQMSDYIEQKVMIGQPLSKYKIFGIPFAKKITSLENFRAIKELANVIRNEKYDKIILHTTLAAYVTRRAIVRSGVLKYGKMLNKYEWKEGRRNEDLKPQVINVVHGYLFDEKSSGSKRWAMLMAERINSKVTSVVVTMNEEDYEIAKANRLYKDKLYNIPGMGIDYGRFANAVKGENNIIDSENMAKDNTLGNLIDSEDIGSGNQTGDSVRSEDIGKKNQDTNLIGSKDMGYKNKKENISAIEEAANTEKSEKKAAREKLGLKQEDFVMIYAAEFSNRKNQSMLIRAMKYLPSEVKLVLAGEGALLDTCRDMARAEYFFQMAQIQEKEKNDSIKVINDRRKVKKRVIFPGQVENPEDYYKVADVCVSSSRSEGLPFNIMEAMAAGLPVVASNVKGHKDLIKQGENGYLYEYDNAKDFASLVKKLMANPELCAQMGANNQIKAEAYSIEMVKSEIMEIYLK